MHVLVSPVEPPASESGDFRWTDPGELVIPGTPCDNPECGCDRAFTGLSTRKGTTVAVVADRVTTEEVLHAAVRESTVRAGWSDEEIHEWWAAVLDATLACAREHPVGARVRVSHHPVEGLRFDVG
jgi:hypothetical protein